jgi:SM-20-related protein
VSSDLRVVNALAAEGWVVLDTFLPAQSVRALAADAQEGLAAGAFRNAGVGAGERHAVRVEVRGDAVHWLEPPGTGAAQRAAFDRFEALRRALNRELQLGLLDFECHYACYPPGSFYRRHLDRLAGDDRRTLSCILYLNDAWVAADGGQLRLHLEHGPHDVLPESGRLVAFLSERFEHEVLPCARDRLSLTGWFRRRAVAH